MSFLNGHVNTLLTKKTNSARRLQKPHQVRGTPSEAPGGQRLEHDPALSSARIQEAKGGLERLLTGTALGTGDAGSQPQAPTAGAGAGLCRRQHQPPGGRASAAPAPTPLPAQRRGPGAPPARPPGPERRPGPWKEAGAAAATPSPPPPLGFTWPGSPRCPDLPPPAMRFPGDKGEGARSGALTPHPPAGRAGGTRYTAPTASEPGAGGRHLSSGSETAPSAQPPCGPGPSWDAVT